MLPMIYAELCPRCSGDLSAKEIEKGVCFKTGKRIGETFLEGEAEKFSEFFEKCIGARPRELQMTWAKRILQGDSFAALAPTGIGKTSFGIVISLFLAQRGKRSYAIMPTTPLVKQFYERAIEYSSKLGLNLEIVAYHSDMRKEEKEGAKKKIESGEFSVLVTTSQFLAKNFSLLRGKRFDFVFVDDVDSVLKASRNIDKILMLLNFSPDEIKSGERKKKRYGILMVSTATGRKGERTRVLRKLLDFDVGSVRDVVRNVEDIYFGEKNLKNLVDILKKFGKGGIIYTRSVNEAKEIHKALVEEGFAAGIVISEKSKEDLDKFAEGKLDILVGVASPYGALVRGIDLPEVIRYVVFYGLPVFGFSVSRIGDLPEGFLNSLGRMLLGDKSRNLSKEEMAREIERALSKDGVYGDILVKEGTVYFPDIRTYIQGSGRTSRLYSGGITKGASLILDSEDVVECFRRRLRYFDFQIKDLNDVDIPSLIKEIDEDRRKIRMKYEAEEIYKPLLFVVESPNKAKQISSFFGKPNMRIIGKAIVYEVPIGKYVVTIAPTIGHMVDLVTQRGYHGVIRTKEYFIPVYSYIRRCEKCGYQFTEGEICPRCGSEEIYRADEQIKVLRKLAFECGRVLVGTDPDTEGEKIAWDVYSLLRGYAKEFARAEFHEVTPRAIIEAINNPREFSENLVKAQVVRRIEDRWIGFELSSIVQKIFKNRNLSAGRAQTPTLGWIIERYRESKVKVRIAEIPELDIRIDFGEVFNKIKVEVVEEGEGERNPPPPYTTDSMLRDANNILHFSATKTMKIAQDLFELGWITYHRTDSTRVSDRGLYVAKEYLRDRFVGRRYSSEGAHECIRPTRAITSEELRRYISEGVIQTDVSKEHFLLYDLIFRRFMASQSPPAKIKFQRLKIKVKDREFYEERIVSVEGGFHEIYPYFIKTKKRLKEGEYIVKPRFLTVSKVLPYTQAEVIGEMKSRGIGRPSTYATILEKLFIRKYIRENRGRIIPTALGMSVYRFLVKNYEKFVSEETTRELERVMDEIEVGKRDYQDVLNELFKEIVSIKRISEKYGKKKLKGTRRLGNT